MIAPTLTDLAIVESSRVHLAAAADLEEILIDVESWVNHDSPTFAVPLVNALAGVMAARMTALGLRTELVDAGPNGRYLHASITGPGRARVALLCHHDTVFPVGTAAARPYRRDSTRIYGPGVCDMKGGIAVAAHTMRLLAAGPRPFSRVELVSVPDEEEREGMPATLERLTGFDAVFTLECGRADHAIVSSRKGGRWVKVEATGRAAHAGVAPADGRNALVALTDEVRRIRSVDGAREGLSANLTVLRGGGSTNTIPDRATMTYDVRGLTEKDLDWAVSTIADHGSPDGIRFSDRLIGWTPPMERTPAVARLAAAAIELGARLGLTFGEATTGGASDGSWAAHAGLPTIDGMGPTGDLDHTTAEYAVIDTFAPRCGIIAGLVAMVDAGLLDGVQR